MSKTSEALDRYREEGIPIPVCVNPDCNRYCAVRDVKASGKISFHNMCSRCKRMTEVGEPLDDGITSIKRDICDNSDGHLGWSCPIAGETHASYQFVVNLVDGGSPTNPDNLQTHCRFCDYEFSKGINNWGN